MCVGRVWHTNEFYMSKYHSDTRDGHMSTHHVFLQLGKAAATINYNGRKKAKIALKKVDKVTCRVSEAHEQWWSNSKCLTLKTFSKSYMSSKQANERWWMPFKLYTIIYVSVLQLCAWALNGRKVILALQYSDKVTCRVVKVHEWWICCSIMYVSLYCSCVRGHTRGMSNIWRNLMLMVSLH